MTHCLKQDYLEAIGIQCWQLKLSQEHSVPVDEELDANDFNNTSEKQTTSYSNSQSDSELLKNSELIAEPEEHYNTPSVVVENSSETVPNLSDESIINFDNNPLLQSIQNCHQCSERKGRLNALIGQGTANASVFIITDAPNAEEDRAGHYLTGLSKSLFQAMLETINITSEYYLTGIVKCFSLDQFLLSADEINNCSKYLHQQLELIKPTVIVSFGISQAQTLLATKESFKELRGKIHTVNINNIEYRLVVTFHPAYLIRNPLFKKEALKDLLLINSIAK